MAPSRAAFIVLVIIFLSTMSATGAAAAEQDVELRARVHFAAGQYKQALDIYVQLYAETLHPTYMRNIGRCYQNMGEPDSALKAFREYLRKAENLDPKQRAEVERYIVEMEELKRQRAASPAPAPGARQMPEPAPVFVSAPGSAEPAAAMTGQARGRVGYAVGAAGLATGAGALGLFLWNKNRNDKFHQTMSSDAALASSIHTASVVTVSLAIGSAALLATGVALVASAPRTAAATQGFVPPAGASHAVLLAPGSVAWRVTW